MNTEGNKSFENRSIEEMLKSVLETNCSMNCVVVFIIELVLREEAKRDVRDSLHSVAEGDESKNRVSIRGRDRRVSVGVGKNEILCISASNLN